MDYSIRFAYSEIEVVLSAALITFGSSLVLHLVRLWFSCILLQSFISLLFKAIPKYTASKQICLIHCGAVSQSFGSHASTGFSSGFIP